MESLRIGLIGLVGRGGLGYYVHRPEEGSEVVAGADADETALSFFRDTYSATTFTSRRYQDLLAQDLDAVIISSPASQREEQAIAALAAGKAVFLDKPMALNVEACDRILDAARASGQKLYVGNALRHTATIRKLIELADAGAVGEV
ncbi:MAG: Gfo/Idh/MocA family oxidoreductase, partial [Candidatus Hydrogenedentes bacterium]|nr:Gfo/Idh/MocA family oxidoreductase [Candidatus Hydrogenedentota bacterium]